MKFLPPVFAALLLFVFGAMAQTTNGLSDAEIQGQQLVQEILEETPVSNFKQTGNLRIEDSRYQVTNIPIDFSTTAITNGYWPDGVAVSEKDHGWETEYIARLTNNFGAFIVLQIIHRSNQGNVYLFRSDAGRKTPGIIERIILNNRLSGIQLMAPFAGSDFWICDLGLEFFHWPDQKILKHEARRTRACALLESTNPHPSAGGYSRVDTWIDNESLGIVHAEAYDANGKLLKVFDPKAFKKVNGQWELQDMEIRNVQTGSRTWIKFNLKSSS